MPKNVSREPSYRYPYPATLLKKMKQNDRKCTNTYTKHTHTSKSSIPENPGVANLQGHVCNKCKENQTKLIYFTIFHINRNGLLSFCIFGIFAQGFSLKVQLVDQHIENMTSFARFSDLIVLKVLIFDTFAGEHVTRPVVYEAL